MKHIYAGKCLSPTALLPAAMLQHIVHHHKSLASIPTWEEGAAEPRLSVYDRPKSQRCTSTARSIESPALSSSIQSSETTECRSIQEGADASACFQRKLIATTSIKVCKQRINNQPDFLGEIREVLPRPRLSLILFKDLLGETLSLLNGRDSMKYFNRHLQSSISPSFLEGQWVGIYL